MLAVVLNEARLLCWSESAELSASCSFGRELEGQQPVGEDRALLGGLLLHPGHQAEHADGLAQRGVTGALAGHVDDREQLLDEGGVLLHHDQGGQVGPGRRFPQQLQVLQRVTGCRRLLLGLSRERAVDLVQLAAHRRRALVGQGVLLLHHGQLGGGQGRRGPPPALARDAQPDVADRLVPLVLQARGEHGDVRAERGELLDPPVGGGTARVGQDPGTAQDHGGERGDGDQQDQAGTHPPVLQRPA